MKIWNMKWKYEIWNENMKYEMKYEISYNSTYESIVYFFVSPPYQM